MHETPVVWIGMQVIIMCVLRFLFAGLCFCKMKMNAVAAIDTIITNSVGGSIVDCI